MLWGILESFIHRRRRVAQMAELRAWLCRYEGGGVALDRDDVSGIALMRLDHPSKRNAISGHMMTAMEDAIESLESWTAGKGVLLYGTGHNFCSGGDLDFVRNIATPADGHRMATFMHSVLARLRRLPLVSVALVEGSGALGGGAEIAMACDFRLMAHDAAGIGFVHRHMGLAPAWGGAARLVQSVGYRTALELMTTGRLVAGKKAVDIGLADDILESEDPVTEAIDWLEYRTRGPPEVVRTIKTMANNARDGRLPEILETEKQLFAPLWGGPANLEALGKKIKHRL